jgi:hypothetical protein
MGLLVTGAMIVLLVGCGVKTPSRDHIPVLKERLYELQLAVADRNRASIDSLLSVKMLDIKQSSDSLLGLVYGPGGDFAFEQFGNYDIAYTKNKARIDCFIMDTTHAKDRPISFTLIYDDDLWLFKRFETDLPALTDTLEELPDSLDTLAQDPRSN